MDERIVVAEILHHRTPTEVGYPERKVTIFQPLKKWVPIATHVAPAGGYLLGAFYNPLGGHWAAPLFCPESSTGWRSKRWSPWRV